MRLYLADAVHRGQQAVLPHVWVAPGSTEGGMHPCGEVKDQLLGLGAHAHVPGWGCGGVGERVSCEKPCWQEVIGGAGLVNREVKTGLECGLATFE